MTKFLKFLLLPVTVALSYIIAFYSFYFGVALIFWLINLSWFWLIIGFTFLMGLIGMLTQFPKIISQVVFDELYGNHWAAIIPHAIGGLIGLVMAIVFYFDNPVSIVTDNEVVYEGISGLWEYSKLRTVIFAVLIFNLLFSSIWMVAQPVFFKERN